MLNEFSDPTAEIYLTLLSFPLKLIMLTCQFLCLVLLVAPPLSAESKLEKYAVTQPHMGVRFEIVCYAQDEKSAALATEAAFARIAQLNKSLSDYDPQSEISKLAATAPHDTDQPISDDLAAVLAVADEIYQQSGGAFDPTIGPLSKLWRRARRLHAFPEMEKLAAARDAVGWKFVEFSAADKTIRFLKPALSLDLGGIAKGFAADEALKVMQDHGINSALINASGDLAASDPPPGQKGWKVGVAPLKADAPPSVTLLLANSGVATSGDAFQFVEIDGKRYSHIFDPHTGMPLTRPSSVTVTATNGCRADAWASAFSVLSPKQAERQVIKTPGIEYFVVESEDGSVQTRRSKGFPAVSETQK